MAMRFRIAVFINSIGVNYYNIILNTEIIPAAAIWHFLSLDSIPVYSSYFFQKLLYAVCLNAGAFSIRTAL